MKDRHEFGGKLHPSILGYKCFFRNSTLKMYPVIQWQGDPLAERNTTRWNMVRSTFIPQALEKWHE
jgi:hypothetical protein